MVCRRLYVSYKDRGRRYALCCHVLLCGECPYQCLQSAIKFLPAARLLVNTLINQQILVPIPPNVFVAGKSMEPWVIYHLVPITRFLWMTSWFQ